MRALSILLFLSLSPIECYPCVPQEKGGLAPTEAGLAATLKEMFSKLLDSVGTLLGSTEGSGSGSSGGSGNPKTKKNRAKNTQGGGFKEAFEAKYGTRYVSLLFVFIILHDEAVYLYCVCVCVIFFFVMSEHVTFCQKRGWEHNVSMWQTLGLRLGRFLLLLLSL